MGHVNQSIAFAKHLDAHYDIISIHFKHALCKPLSYLFDRCKLYTHLLFSLDTPLNLAYDCVVSAGSSTYYANKTLSKKLGIKSITMMLPKGYRYDFDVIFAQSHDKPPKQANMIEIPANFSYVEPKGLFAPNAQSIGIIIGGSNAHLTMLPKDIKHYLNLIFEQFPNHEIAITTSPRTSKEIETLIETYPFSYRVIFSQNKINPIADFLHHCEVVFITMDSTSMISEAISYGHASIEVLPLNSSKSNKFFTMVHALALKGYVHLFQNTIGTSNKKIDFKAYAQKIFA